MSSIATVLMDENTRRCFAAKRATWSVILPSPRFPRVEKSNSASTMCRLLYAGRGLHGQQASSERHLRGWALLMNFRPFARRSGQVREHQSPTHRLNGKSYHQSWLQNLLISASLMGRHQLTPAIR